MGKCLSLRQLPTRDWALHFERSVGTYRYRCGNCRPFIALDLSKVWEHTAIVAAIAVEHSHWSGYWEQIVLVLRTTFLFLLSLSTGLITCFVLEPEILNTTSGVEIKNLWKKTPLLWMFLRWHGGLLWLARLIRFEQLRYNYNDNILYSTSTNVRSPELWFPLEELGHAGRSNGPHSISKPWKFP